jgi:hypothetical protein
VGQRPDGGKSRKLAIVLQVQAFKTCPISLGSLVSLVAIART